MVERRDIATWLEGPGRRRQPAGGYAGQRLGLPAAGRGSVASFGRRLAALVVDWVASLLVARAFTPNQWAPLGVLAVESVLLLTTMGSTFGMRVLGLRVATLSSPGPLVAPWRAVVRSVLLCAAVPAVIWDRDGRGLHDKAAGTVVVRSR